MHWGRKRAAAGRGRVPGMNHVPYMRAFHEKGVTVTINTRLHSIRRDGNALVVTLFSDFAEGWRAERRVDQVVVEHGTLPLADLYFELKPLSKSAIPAAIQKAERYRLLNEPQEAESICLDILAIDPDNREAPVVLLLALTDQFDEGRPDCVQRADERDVIEIVPRRLGERSGLAPTRHAPIDELRISLEADIRAEAHALREEHDLIVDG